MPTTLCLLLKKQPLFLAGLWKSDQTEISIQLLTIDRKYKLILRTLSNQTFRSPRHKPGPHHNAPPPSRPQSQYNSRHGILPVLSDSFPRNLSVFPGDYPAFKHSVQFQPEIPMKACCMVLLNDKSIYFCKCFLLYFHSLIA